MPTIAVDEELLEEFRAAVLAKHGKVYGHLREEAREALRKRIDEMNKGEPRPSRRLMQVERQRHFPELEF